MPGPHDRREQLFRKALCIHEAGHAALAVAVGMGLEQVEILESPRGRGCYRAARTVLGPPRGRREDHILFLLAGRLAEGRAGLAVVNPISARQDRREVHQLARAVCPAPVVRKAYLHWLRAEVLYLLRRPAVWRTVRAVARALARRGRLTGRQVRALARAAGLGPPYRPGQARR